uniref:Protein kinase domain-containing protein n=1 Tax=Echeneis naucrates TaxID=173247 RepID=A0A665UIJ3_ECHNA
MALTEVNNTTCYQILDFNGEGSFGQVVKCLDLNTSEIVAIKIHKDNKDDLIKREVAMLEAVIDLCFTCLSEM